MVIMKQNEPIAFWEANANPVTMFKSTFREQSKRPGKQYHTKWTTVKTFVDDDYIESKVIAETFSIGTVMLCKLMGELGYERVCYCGKKYFLKTQVSELKSSDLLNVKHQSKLNKEWMISSTELAETYNVLPWQRHKIIEASGLKPVMRNSGKVYFDKAKLIPFFEAFKNGTIKYKPRIKNKKL